MSIHGQLEGKGISLAHNSDKVPNGHMVDASIPLGDAASKEVAAKKAAAVKKVSSFKSELKGL